MVAGLDLSILDGVLLYFSSIEYRFVFTFLLSNIDSSLPFFYRISICLLFRYRFPTLNGGNDTKLLF